MLVSVHLSIMCVHLLLCSPPSPFPSCSVEGPLEQNDLPTARILSSILLAGHLSPSSGQIWRWPAVWHAQWWPECPVWVRATEDTDLTSCAMNSSPFSVLQTGFSAAAAAPCQCPHKEDTFRLLQRRLLILSDLSAAGILEPLMQTQI